MKKIFKHLFMLTMLFIVPMFVYADETTPFSNIDINENVSLKYTVLSEVKTYSATLDSSLAGISLYKIEDGATTSLSTENVEYIEDSHAYRISGDFSKSDKYKIEYKFNVDVNGNNKEITYEKEYSFEEGNDGIVININSEESVKTFAPKLIINKTVKKLTPDGTFTFSVNGTNVTIKTGGATEDTEGSGSEIVYLELNKSYTVNEINIPNTYKVESVSSDKGTVGDDNSVTFTTNGDIDYEIVVNYRNESKVDHSKDLVDNGDGTHQISLDVTGENEKNPANKANVVVILDISGSMDNETGNTISQMYNAVAPGGNNLYGIVNNNYISLTRGQDGNYYYQSGNRWVQYTGILYERTTKETRMIAARNAIKSLSQALLANNTTENPDVVKMALVTFSTTATTAVNPTFSYSDMERVINETYATGGTNWEDALDEASSINFGTDREATTYYIFVSDGNPTFRNTADNSTLLPLTDNTAWYYRDYSGIHMTTYNSYGRTYYYYDLFKNDDYSLSNSGVYGLGNDSQTSGTVTNYNYSPTSMQRCYNNARDDAKDAVDDGVVLYTIGAYGNVNRMQSLTNYAYTGSDTTAPQGTFYYNASNTAALNQAFRDILAEIERSGIGAVTIDDGTTNMITVETSTGTEDYKLLTVDTTSYKYWLKFPVTVKNGKKYIYVNDTEVEVNNSATTLTWQGHDPLTITDSKFSDDGEYFIYSWKGENYFYNVAPPQATLENGSIKWVLSKESVGVLLNGVTYSVTVNVWPSQFTYDLIADLNNGIKNYDDLPDEVKEYFREVGGSYILSTNTTAKLTYDDSRDEEGPRTTNYVNPNPVNTGVSELSIEKKWYNGLDSREASDINIYLTKDTNIYKQYTLTSSNGWKTNASISTGLISFDEATKTATIREVGHEYSFKEGEDDAYYWDLVVDVFRPMIINDEVKMLVKVTGVSFEGNYYCDEATGKEYFKIEGNVYVVSENNNSIVAKNYRRSNLNITKKVEGDYDPDTLFRFTLVVNDNNHNDVWFSIYDGTGYVLDTDNPTKYVSGATPEIIKTSEHITGIVDNGDGTISYYEDGKLKKISFIKEINGSYYTGFYYAPSGGTITANMKAGWNLRFTNLPNNSTYTFNEILDAPLGNGKYLSDAFTFSKVELNEVKKDNNQTIISNETTYTSNSVIIVENFKIEQYNTQYTVIYTNTPVTISKEVVKTWLEDNNDANHTRPGNITVHLYADKVLKDTVTISSTDNWKHTWSGLAKFNAQGKEIEYTVDEASVSNYLPVINGFNIVNYYNLRDIVVNKQWGNSAKTPEVEVKISSDYNNYNVTKPLNEGNGWTNTWTDLLKYYLDNNNLLQTINYMVEEVKIGGKEVVNNVLIDFDDYIKSKIGKWTSVVSGNMNQGFTITNTYTKYDKELSFKKMSFDDFNNNKTDGLIGAVFRLYKYIGKYNGASEVSLDTDNPLVDSSNWIYVGEAISNGDGLMLFNNIYKDGSVYLNGLYEGEYRLVEIQAPAGYVKVDGQWRIFIDLDEENDTVTIRDLANSNTYIGRTTAVSMVGNDIVVLNEKVPEIPTTGGIGIPHYNKYGLLIVALSIVMFLMGLMNQKKQIKNI